MVAQRCRLHSAESTRLAKAHAARPASAAGETAQRCATPQPAAQQQPWWLPWLRALLTAVMASPQRLEAEARNGANAGRRTSNKTGCSCPPTRIIAPPIMLTTAPLVMAVAAQHGGGLPQPPWGAPTSPAALARSSLHPTHPTRLWCLTAALARSGRRRPIQGDRLRLLGLLRRALRPKSHPARQPHPLYAPQPAALGLATPQRSCPRP